MRVIDPHHCERIGLLFKKVRGGWGENLGDLSGVS